MRAASFFVCNDYEASKRLAIAGLATSLMPAHTVQRELRSGELVELDLDWRLDIIVVALMDARRQPRPDPARDRRAGALHRAGSSWRLALVRLPEPAMTADPLKVHIEPGVNANRARLRHLASWCSLTLFDRPPWHVVSSRELAKTFGVTLQTIANWRVRDVGPPPVAKGGRADLLRPAATSADVVQAREDPARPRDPRRPPPRRHDDPATHGQHEGHPAAARSPRSEVHQSLRPRHGCGRAGRARKCRAIPE